MVNQMLCPRTLSKEARVERTLEKTSVKVGDKKKKKKKRLLLTSVPHFILPPLKIQAYYPFSATILSFQIIKYALLTHQPQALVKLRT